MREFSSHSSWLSSAKYHLSQIMKGALVSGAMVSGYVIWKRWSGNQSQSVESSADDARQSNSLVKTETPPLFPALLIVVNII